MQQVILVKKHLSKQQKTTLIITYIVLGIIAITVLYPLFLMINISLKTYREFLQSPTQLVKTFYWGNFVTVFSKMKFATMTLNSIFYCGISAIISCMIALLAAYPLSRQHFRGSKFAYSFILMSMFLPGSLIANIVLVKDILHIFGTRFNLMFLWSLSSIQMNIFMMIGFIRQLPKDLDEAAWVDGCPYFKFIFVISMPLLMPIIATVFTFRFIAMWNDFLTPFIYLSNPDHRPLATGLYFFKGQYASKWNELSAAIILVAAPMVVLYVFMQRFIIEGMTAGALKG